MYGAQVLTVFNKRIRRAYEDPRPHQFLHKLKPYILDLVGSTEIQSYTPYAYDSVRRAVDAYYKGDMRQASGLDWWLTFEVWRQLLCGKP